jgi:hypothetical protein
MQPILHILKGRNNFVYHQKIEKDAKMSDK